MPPRIVALLLLVASTSLSAFAGTRFNFVADAPGYSYRGRMTIDGENHRIDVTDGNHPQYDGTMSIITRRAGAEAIILDHRSQTWFQRDLAGIAGPLVTARGIGATTLVHSRVWKEREQVDEAGATERHIVYAEYTIDMEIDGEHVPAEIRMRGEFDIGPRIAQIAHPWGLQFGAKTGIAKLDAALATRIPNRLPLRQVVTASRQIAGGEVYTETFTLVVSDVVEDDTIGVENFAAPAGYAYREPFFNYGQ